MSPAAKHSYAIAKGESVTADGSVVRPQFSIRSLLLLTAAVAVTLGFVVARGIGTVPLSLGVVWSTLNAAGWLKYWQQTTRARSNWIWLAWLLFLLSLCLPSAEGCGNKILYGWQLAFEAGAAEGTAFFNFARQDNPPTSFELFQGVLILTPLNVGNLLLLVAPLSILLFRRERGHWMTNTIAVCGVMAWVIPWSNENELPKIGYFVWCLSFAALSSARQLPWKVWWMMTGYLGLVIFMAHWDWIYSFSAGWLTIIRTRLFTS